MTWPFRQTSITLAIHRDYLVFVACDFFGASQDSDEFELLDRSTMVKQLFSDKCVEWFTHSAERPINVGSGDLDTELRKKPRQVWQRVLAKETRLTVDQCENLPLLLARVVRDVPRIGIAHPDPDGRPLKHRVEYRDLDVDSFGDFAVVLWSEYEMLIQSYLSD
jgi:hypothetical protein